MRHSGEAVQSRGFRPPERPAVFWPLAGADGCMGSRRIQAPKGGAVFLRKCFGGTRTGRTPLRRYIETVIATATTNGGTPHEYTTLADAAFRGVDSLVSFRSALSSSPTPQSPLAACLFGLWLLGPCLVFAVFDPQAFTSDSIGAELSIVGFVSLMLHTTPISVFSDNLGVPVAYFCIAGEALLQFGVLYVLWCVFSGAPT